MDKKYEEKTVHGTPFRPFAVYHTDISEALPFYPIHWHKEMEIIRVQEGVGLFQIGEESYVASSGDIIIINPYVMHSINRYEANHMTIDAIVFDLNMLASNTADIYTIKYFAALLDKKNSAPCIIRRDSEHYHPFDQSVTTILMLSNDRTEAYELAIKANLYWLFYHMYSNHMISVRSVSEDNERIKLALDYIAKNYIEDISVSKLSELCGYSEYYFVRLFKHITGVKCTEYLNNYRLNKAGEALLSYDEAIVDIAYKCGYNNISYFNKQFKEAYGMTPKEYRAVKA